MLFLIPELASTISFSLVIIGFGIFGGLLIIPLNALIQHHSPYSQLGTILAGNNWLQNIVMTAFLVVTLLAAVFNTESVMMLGFLPVITLAIALFLYWKWRQYKN